MPKVKDHSLYLVISEEYGKGRGAVGITRAAIAGGVDIIQMREKDKARSELIKLGKELSGFCKKSGVTFIVNDDPVLAKETGADGVHLGQEDLKKHSIEDARRILGKDAIMGISTHSIEQFEDANEKDVDYIAFGPIFETKTKDYCIGAGGIERVLKIARRPVFFIGGIDIANIGAILNKGAKNIALIRGITEADDIISRTKEFKRAIEDGNKDKW